METKKARVLLLPVGDWYMDKLHDNVVLAKYVTDSGVGPDSGWTNKEIGTSFPVEYQDHHLYFVTDDEIKEGDRYINLDDKTRYWKAGEQCPVRIANDAPSCKKIVATTNLNLINIQYKKINDKDGLHLATIPKDRNQKLLPKPSQEFINIYCEKYFNINEVLIELHRKPVMLSKHQSKIEYSTEIKVNQNNEITIHLIKESYTREEHINALWDLWQYLYVNF